MDGKRSESPTGDRRQSEGRDLRFRQVPPVADRAGVDMGTGRAHVSSTSHLPDNSQGRDVYVTTQSPLGQESP